VFCVVGVACTNSKLVLRRLYNSMDNRFEDPLLAHTEFDKNQTREIQQLIDHYHVWHRKTQLDDYALLLDDVVRHLRDKNTLNQTDIDRWSDAIQTYMANITSCSPFYASANIMASMTDQQISDIKRHREKSREERRAKRKKREDDNPDFTLADSIDDRVKQINRYAGLAGLDLNREQLDDLRKTMASVARPTTSFGDIRKKLDKEFYELLEQRDSGNETRTHNRAIWESYALRTFQSLDDAQKRDAADYLDKLASTLKALAADRPSFQQQSASDYACMGQPVS